MSYINKENKYITYTLEQEEKFYDIGYKVMQNQEKNGLIKCHKILHNGKVKLIYNISSYKSLKSIILSITTERLITILVKLLEVVNDIKEIGFIEYGNINTNVENIFIDMNSLNVKLLYLPIVATNERNKEMFIEELLTNILLEIQKGTHRDDVLDKLRAGVRINKSIEELLEDLKYINQNNGNRVITNIEKNKELIEESYNTFGSDNKNKRTKKDTQQSQKEKKGVLAKLFSTKGKSNKVEEGFSSIREEELEESGTSMLTYVPETTLYLEGINTPTKTVLYITKENFVIGSRSELVDGVISFNKTVSRRHCSIISEQEELFIMDLGSSNGTFLNDMRIEKNKKFKMIVGDRLRISNIDFVLKQE